MGNIRFYYSKNDYFLLKIGAKVACLKYNMFSVVLVLHPGDNYSFALPGTGMNHVEQNSNYRPGCF